MTIRTVPFNSLDESHVNELFHRATREDRTIDYKLELRLSEQADRAELLKDITAFANATGGTLLHESVRRGLNFRQSIPGQDIARNGYSERRLHP